MIKKKNLEKVDRLRPQMQSNLVTDETPWSPAIWPSFDQVTLSTCKNIIEHLRPTGCSHNVMPARFLKQVINIVGADICSFINLSLSTGMVPDSLKHATITPVLKTPNSDTSILSNFRPISNLPFMSKNLEKVVLISCVPITSMKLFNLVSGSCIVQNLPS